MLGAGTLYGTTCPYWTNRSNLGTVFKLNTDGSGFSVLAAFTGYNGCQPQAGLVLSGITL